MHTKDYCYDEDLKKYEVFDSCGINAELCIDCYNDILDYVVDLGAKKGNETHIEGKKKIEAFRKQIEKMMKPTA